MATLPVRPSPCPPPPLLAVGLNAAAVLLLGGLTVLASLQAPAARPGLDVVVLALGVLLVPVTLRRPVPGTLALAALAALSPAGTPALSLGLLHVARTHRPRTTAWAAAAAVAASAGQGWWRPAGGLSYGWWLALIVAAYAALVGWGLQTQSRRALIGSLRERAERAEAEQAATVVQARQLERNRIAAEMHDVLAHRLSLLSTYAGAVEYRPDAAPEQLAKAAAVLRSTAHQALEDLREVIGVLRAGELSADGTCRPQPVLDDLPGLVQQARDAGQPVELVQDLPGGDLPGGGAIPGGTGRTVYRVVQEGLTNARKHAAGQPVTVLVRGRPGEGLLVEVANSVGPASITLGSGTLGSGTPGSGTPGSGTPGSGTPGSGTGLVGLAERMSVCGGRIEHGRQGDRFRLRAWLPWPPE